MAQALDPPSYTKKSVVSATALSRLNGFRRPKLHKTYKVEGMTCCGCAGSVEKAIKDAAPGAGVAVNVSANEVAVDGIDDDELVKKAVEDAGFDYRGVA